MKTEPIDPNRYLTADQIAKVTNFPQSLCRILARLNSGPFGGAHGQKRICRLEEFHSFWKDYGALVSELVNGDHLPPENK